MRVDWAVPCRFAEVNANLITIAGGGIDRFWVEGVPLPLSFMVALRLVAPHDEWDADRRHEIKNVVTGPDGNVVGELGGEFSAAIPDAQADWLSQLMMAFGIQFVAEAEGTYTVDIRVEGQSYQMPLHVVVGAPPGGPPPD